MKITRHFLSYPFKDPSKTSRLNRHAKWKFKISHHSVENQMPSNFYSKTLESDLGALDSLVLLIVVQSSLHRLKK